LTAADVELPLSGEGLRLGRVLRLAETASHISIAEWYFDCVYLATELFADLIGRILHFLQPDLWQDDAEFWGRKLSAQNCHL